MFCRAESFLRRILGYILYSDLQRFVFQYRDNADRSLQPWFKQAQVQAALAADLEVIHTMLVLASVQNARGIGS